MKRILELRAATSELVRGLSAEDCMVQSMDDASPITWHLAHTTWFFETFVLGPYADVPPHEPRWGYLFNSYYEAVGPRQARARRGDLSRPGLAEVLGWRERVDAHLAAFLDGVDAEGWSAAQDAVELGLQHEQQHQELILTDLKHHFASNPLRPSYRTPRAHQGPGRPLGWVGFDGGLVEIGAGAEGFAFDNERPRHRVWLEPYALADRLVTRGEWEAFIADGGYERPLLWLADGWAWRVANQVTAPLYWEGDGLFTLSGLRARDPVEPVVHVSFYEAEAFARWAGARLPTEAEWEHAFQGAPAGPGGFVEGGAWHPRPAGNEPGLRQGAGEAWQWTRSAYEPYPGFRPIEGAFGEYNGKFMVNQLVVRGASCATPRAHARTSYRNFFHPPDRWQFLGVRLARDARGAPP